ncbi:hypothetical protein SKAU_G00011280 [Synaphobranchus kaupii]|uniref:C2H2-type domain-containing protein n=1 Tax=Synaphobranchus kaupii TaxID=118154 RepID=A0A9Q1GB55_SYNKA|nr:hypothetical protein SKAU_G00011280 [Synaphobranchus kaupii]
MPYHQWKRRIKRKEKMDAVPCRGGTVINEQDSSQLAKLEAQVVQQGKCQSPKLQEFALLSSLQLHKHSNATLSCQFCQRVFPCTTSLSTHLLQQHTAVPESQGLEGQPLNYLFNQQDGGPYACAPSLTSLPLAQSPPSPIRPHLCSLCPREFRSQAGLACHQRLRHPVEWKRAQSRFWKEGGDKFPCPFCDKVFCHSPSLSRHHARCHKKVNRKTMTKHRRKSQLFPCRSCDMVFSQTSKLYLHRKEQHRRLEGNGEQMTAGATGKKKRRETHPCHLCSKVFPDPVSHWAHLKTHRGQQKRKQRGKMVCEPDKEQEVAHRRLFQCQQCDKAFRHRCDLNRHLNTHSKIREKSDPVWGPASEIGGGPAGKGERRRVKVDQEHGECQEKGDDGTFPCPSCEEVFSLHSALREHEEVHRSMGGVGRCSVCSHGMDNFRRMGRKVAGFYHCVPCKHAFRTLSVFLQHCQMHLLPCKDKEGGADSSHSDD